MKIKPNRDLQELAMKRQNEGCFSGGRAVRLAAEKEQRRKARNRRKAGKV